MCVSRIPTELHSDSLHGAMESVNEVVKFYLAGGNRQISLDILGSVSFILLVPLTPCLKEVSHLI